ncbi:MAG: helix-turn-helix domain-containing protein, partial [Phycisphaeraceae bacterium]|nr:helix-turn-helix domain-containing protein [Phycisphaeraceae bacterium]
ASDPDVVAALAFMWDHIGDDVSVEDIVEEVGVSRRKLERAFAQELGRGIWEEYSARRLEKARELLVMTDQPIAEVAEAMGFSSQSHFGRAFKKGFEMTPRQCRVEAQKERKAKNKN